MFKVWNDSDAGYKTRVEIDGEEVSGLFNSLTITAGIKTAVKIELDMPLADQGRFEDSPTTLVFPAAGMRELLIKHGWTPPTEDRSVVARLAEDVVAVVAPAIESTE